MNALLLEIDALKARLSELRPLPPEAMTRIDEAIKVEYTYESNRIEGNTLTLSETALVINEGVTVGGHPLREHLEAINHAEAVGFIRQIATRQTPIDENVVRDIHALVLHGINPSFAGRYRNVPVVITGSSHTPPQPYLIAVQMEEFIAHYQRLEAEKTHPVLIAAYLHDQLVRIHPFIDGNGRTSRLLMNLYLLRHGYPIVMLKGDDDSRVRYYRTLEESHTTGNRDHFDRLIADAVKEALEKYLSIVDYE